MKMQDRRQIAKSLSSASIDIQSAQSLWQAILNGQPEPDTISQLKNVTEDLLESINKWKALIPNQ